MDCRDPETTGHLWGSFGGCLEEPSLEKMPTKVHYQFYIVVATLRFYQSTPVHPQLFTRRTEFSIYVSLYQ